MRVALQAITNVCDEIVNPTTAMKMDATGSSGTLFTTFYISPSRNPKYQICFLIIKPTRCTDFTNLFFHETLHVSGSSSVHHQEFIHCAFSSNWETSASRRKLSRICAVFKAYSGEGALEAIGDRLQRPHYLSRVDHEGKIRSRSKGRI